MQPTRIAVIKANPATYLNERVRIDGFVTQFVDAGQVHFLLLFEGRLGRRDQGAHQQGIAARLANEILD